MRVIHLTAVFLILLGGNAFAEPKCDSKPGEKWLTEAEMKAKLDELDVKTDGRTI